MTQFRFTVISLTLAIALAGCKIIPTAEKQNQASLNSAQASDQGFDAKVAALWDSKLVPYAKAKAGDFAEVKATIAANADVAGAKYGYKEKGGSAPWTVLTRVTGKIVAVNLESRAATLDIDQDGDGKADVQVQIGPVIRGTALRDSLDFVNFNDFTNQIDFAQFGKAFNTYTNEKVLKAFPRENLVGKSASVIGAFPLPQPGSVPLITPIKIELAQ